MRLPVPLVAEIVAARAAGRLSRLAGAGGGTTVPGKLLWKLDPGAVDRLAARLPLGSALVSATNGKTTTAAMTAEILGPRVRLAHNRSGANLVSGVASTLLEVRDAQLGLFDACTVRYHLTHSHVLRLLRCSTCGNQNELESNRQFLKCRNCESSYDIRSSTPVMFSKSCPRPPK